MKRMSGPWRAVFVVSVLLALGGLGAAGWYGFQWYHTSAGTSAEALDDRDGALKAARQLAVTLQTINPNRPEEGLDAWEAAATGDLLDQLRRDRVKYLDQLKQSPSTSTASVLETALSDLDVSAGTATAITAMDVTQSPVVDDKLGAPTVRQLRVKLTLKKTDAGWKASSTSMIQA
jgi:Mce-associated membrane protein